MFLVAVVSRCARVFMQFLDQFLILAGIRVALLALDLDLLLQVEHALLEGFGFGLVDCDCVMAETHADCVLFEFAHFGGESGLIGVEAGWVCWRS